MCIRDSWDSASQKLPDANLALISVAGEYAAELANQALDRNLNVMMFSDNVTLEDESQLKTRAREKCLLVMGPDCGTSMIAATPLAFANVMPEGNIGVIGASGTEMCIRDSYYGGAGRPVVGNHPDYHPWRSIARDTDQRYRYQMCIRDRA